jgi:hypothetical protein
MLMNCYSSVQRNTRMSYPNNLVDEINVSRNFSKIRLFPNGALG